MKFKVHAQKDKPATPEEPTLHLMLEEKSDRVLLRVCDPDGKSYVGGIILTINDRGIHLNLGLDRSKTPLPFEDGVVKLV